MYHKFQHKKNSASNGEPPNQAIRIQHIENRKSLSNSLENMRNRINELENMFQQQKTKKEEIEERFSMYKQRSALREKEFFRVLQSINKQVAKYKQPTLNTPSTQIFHQLYKQLYEKFEQSNQTTNKFIEQHYKDNLSSLQRRINEILMVSKEQNLLNKELLSDKYGNIHHEIKEVIELAANIEQYNIYLEKSLRQEKQKRQLLAEEKKRLLDDIIAKKNLIVKLKNEIKTITNIKDHSSHIKQRLRPATTNPIEKDIRTCSLEFNRFDADRGKTQRSRYSTRPLTCSLRNAEVSVENFHYEGTIEHLKECLKRQKKKVHELNEIVKKLMSSQNEKKNQKGVVKLGVSGAKIRLAGDQFQSLLQL